MTFKGDWKAIKTKYETVTGKQKPAETNFLGIRKSSGIESGLEALDKAVTKANFVKALAKYDSAMKNFATICTKELNAMRVAVKKLASDGAANAVAERDKSKIVEKAFADMWSSVETLQGKIDAKGATLT